MLYIEQALNYTNQTVSAEKKQKQRNNRVDKCPPDCPPDIDTINQNLDIRNQILDDRNKEIIIVLSNGRGKTPILPCRIYPIE